jgi:hypothetical protein
MIPILVVRSWQQKRIARNRTHQSLPYLISIRRMRLLATNKTSRVTISKPGTEIHAGVGSATTASGPSDKGTGTREFK